MFSKIILPVIAIFAVTFIAMLVPTSGATVPTARGAQYGVMIERDVQIRMRDGVDLLADVYHPSKDGKPVEGRWPVVLIRTSYNKEDPAHYLCS